MNNCSLSLLSITAVLTFSGWSRIWAQDALQPEEDALSAPYAFNNDAFGFAVGYAYGRTSWPQPQAAALGSIMAGTNDSLMAFGILHNFQLPGTERFFVDVIGSAGTFGEIDSYIDGNPNFPDEGAGSNDSDEDNFISGDGIDVFGRARFRYILPIGHGADQAIPDYQLNDGFLVGGATGGTSWNPLKSGLTSFQIEPFYRYQDINSSDGDVELATNGVEIGLLWDNRDFPNNPSQGYSLRAEWSQDFGLMDSSEDWTNFQFESDLYFGFGASKWFRQRVLAFNFWTSLSPSWDETSDGTTSNRPPPYTGSALGGLWRMKGFPNGRFNDKAAIYYSAEMRLTPHWNPFVNWEWIQEKAGVDWIQIVPFVEIGRVADSWDFSELHEDMQWDAGIGLRASAQGFVVRADTAFSEEQVGVKMMIGHSFQF